MEWGNWYISLSAHEFGWPGANSVLNLYGSMRAEHRILFDSPRRVRKIDVAAGQLIEQLRRILVLHYCWDRDRKGYVIKDHVRAQVLGVSNSVYLSLLGLAECAANSSLEDLDNGVHSSDSLHTCVIAPAINAI